MWFTGGVSIPYVPVVLIIKAITVHCRSNTWMIVLGEFSQLWNFFTTCIQCGPPTWGIQPIRIFLLSMFKEICIRKSTQFALGINKYYFVLASIFFLFLFYIFLYTCVDYFCFKFACNQYSCCCTVHMIQLTSLHSKTVLHV